MGDNVGQKAYPAGIPAHSQPLQMGAGPGDRMGRMGGMGGGVGQIGMQNMLAQQNREMEAQGSQRARV
ncbi:hypothetical protein FIBSPDRAFT_155957 [Athelia psychrophila]|uniref:Uncharacterized protein n=1 Tax=Athelia psychrophila TaxID=1759441 RepID=A0A166BBH4_9AGAM|nr:hypothetical protein FIBSPDRAFT_155957 [Fibularhizoctonia sp. CBS 109695]